MEVILLERVEKLGQMGQVVKVKPGFARNYLLPQKKALRASKANLELFEKQRATLEAQNLERRKDATFVAQKMEGVSVVITRQAGETGVLYGSVSSRDIADALEAAGYKTGRQQVAIDQPIKTLGLFKVRIVLHPEVSVSVTVNVARTQEEAELQAQRGGMVTAADLLEEEEAEETTEGTEGEAEEA
ncbi:50S ribosomal protein L9 [Azospirillum sp.]|uniref:50S ribosomal protein L9 n=1 Tax=Azospirillum sp. TaxID=34012 RepID=UPI002D3E8BB2|nr:50S ribosomal protein L9 [Azospirillum sp.]HYD70383.1 50S ribosomal protein L9 [Azospirillum sp.]